MKYSIIVVLVLRCGQCLSQSDYEKTLTLRMDQIKNLAAFNNKVVVKVDSVNYNDLDFPYWTSSDTYYQEDIARYKYREYMVLADSTKGHRPDISQTDWALIRGPHPYLFLRDTARIEDLKKLMLDEHPYIRSYAFGALSFRKSDNLFRYIVDNMGDATKMLEFSGDVGLSAYPADLMIEYEIDRLSAREKKKLRDLIHSKYKYLSRGLAALSEQ